MSVSANDTTITPRPFPPPHPHGELREVLPDVFRVTGSINIGRMRFSRGMTVVRQGGDLILVNTVRLNDEGLAALDGLGRVAHVLRIGGWHGSDDAFYKDRYSCPVTSVKGQRYFEGTTAEKGNTYFAADQEVGEDDGLPIAGASLYVINTTPPEALLRIPVGGGTLLSADALLHWPEADDYFNILGKFGMRLAGMVKPFTMMKPWVDKYKPDRSEIAGILELDFDNVLPGHGQDVIGGAKEKFRPALEAYARG